MSGPDTHPAAVRRHTLRDRLFGVAGLAKFPRRGVCLPVATFVAIGVCAPAPEAVARQDGSTERQIFPNAIELRADEFP